MVKRTGGSRRKTRRKLAKNVRKKGKISIKNYLQEFKAGDAVLFKAEPAMQKGMYFRRFHGKSGKIIKKRGNCYEIKYKDDGKIKTIISHPIHLRRF